MCIRDSAKSFAMLGRLAQDMAKNIAVGSDESLSNLVAQLEQHVKNCLTASGIPREPERQRLTALIDALRHRLVAAGGRSASDEPRTRPLLAPQPDIVVIDPDGQSSLNGKLEDSGYRVRQLTNLMEAEERLND